MKKFKIKKGRHYSTPLLANATRYLSKSKAKDVQSYVFMLDDSCEYCKNNELGGDCKDWNKLLGMSFSPRWNARKNSVMLAWRHTSGSGLEVQPYLHGWKGVPQYEDYISFQIKKNVYYLVEISRDAIFLSQITDIIFDKETGGYDYSIPELPIWHWSLTNKKDFKSSKRFRQINTWFGGNRKAPQNITIQLDRRF